MTVTALPVRDEYTATAGQTIFNYTFLIFTNQDLNVYITPSGQDANDSTDITTAYTVDTGTIGNPVGGFITLDVGASSGDLVTIVSSIVENRTTDYQNSGDFLPDVVNKDFDRVVALVKQIDDRSGRTLAFPDSLQNATELTLPSPEAGQYVIWNPAETGLINAGAPAVVIPGTNVGNVAAMVADTTLQVGDYVFTTGYILSGDGGDNSYEIVAGGTGTDDGGSYIDLANGLQAKGLFPQDLLNVLQFGAVRDFNTTSRTGTDNRAFFQAAIDYVSTTPNIGTNYIYETTISILVPHGDYGFELTGSQRLLVNSNNVRIIGEGMFNTNLYHKGTSNVAEFIRFLDSYSCELSSLTIDGGLPFTPGGTETYGVDTTLVLDQCAHFTSEHLNLTNYRIRGKQCIHVWESYFEELRIFNGGFFGTGAVPSAGIAFDDRGKESTAFSGAESNQIYYGKVAFGTVGTLVKMTAPCFNIDFDFVVAEGRTWTVDYAPLGEAKWIIDGLSSGIVVHQAWSYHHDQPFNNNAILFNTVNAGQGCRFLGYRVYQEIPTASGNFLEAPNIFANSSAHPVEVDLSIEDVGDAVTTLFASATAGSMVTGRMEYRIPVARGIDDFMGSNGILYYSGDVTFIDGAFTTSTPDVYHWGGKERKFSQMEGAGSYEEFACRGLAKFNGVTSSVDIEKGITITKLGTGSYHAALDTAFPDANYSVNLSMVLANLGDQISITTMTASLFTFDIRDNAGTFHDSSLITVSVFK